MNVTQKQKEMLLVKKFEYCAGKSVAKFSEPYGTGKNILFHYSCSCCSKKTICI